MTRTATLFAVVLILAAADSVRADTLYVKSKTSDVKKKPRGSAKTVVSVPFGEAVDAGKKKKRWLQIRYKGKKGWIYASALSKQKPQDDPSLRAEDGGALSSEEVDASSAVRGVGPTANNYSSSNQIQQIHKDYLDYHQSFVVSDQGVSDLPANRVLLTAVDLDAFMRRGALGPYAGEPQATPVGETLRASAPSASLDGTWRRDDGQTYRLVTVDGKLVGYQINGSYFGCRVVLEIDGQDLNGEATFSRSADEGEVIVNRWRLSRKGSRLSGQVEGADLNADGVTGRTWEPHTFEKVADIRGAARLRTVMQHHLRVDTLLADGDADGAKRALHAIDIPAGADGQTLTDRRNALSRLR